MPFHGEQWLLDTRNCCSRVTEMARTLDMRRILIMQLLFSNFEQIFHLQLLSRTILCSVVCACELLKRSASNTIVQHLFGFVRFTILIYSKLCNRRANVSKPSLLEWRSVHRQDQRLRMPMSFRIHGEKLRTR